MVASSSNNTQPINFLSLLSTDYGVYNRAVAHLIGLHEAIFLGFLADWHEFHRKSGSLEVINGEEYVFATIDKVEERTVLTRKQQDLAIKNLKSKGIIKVNIQGCPPKRYFTIVKKAILDLFGLQENSTIMSERDKSICPKGTNQDVPKGQIHLYIENPKEEPKIREDVAPSADDCSKLSSNGLEEAEELAKCLLNAIKSFKPDFVPQGYKNWAKDIDRMLRIDKRTHSSILEIISRLPEDEFWRKNVLSGDKLRLKFDQLELYFSAAIKNSLIESNKNFVRECLRDNSGLDRVIEMRGNFVSHKRNHKELPYTLPIQTFQEAFINLTKGRYEN